MNKEQKNLLYTCRWHARELKKNLVGKSLQHAEELYTLLSQLLGDAPGEEVEPDRPDDPPTPEVRYEEPRFEVVRGVKFAERGNYKTKSGKFSGLVVHYTVGGRTRTSAISTLRYLANHKDRLGCMVMDEDGIIYIPEGFDPIREWGYHAGVSKWNGVSGVSSIFAGMEICCWGRNSKVGPFRESAGEANIIKGKYQTYTEAQEKALINFCLWALAVNPEFKVGNIVGHDELRTQAGRHGDKQDPGASLSMTMPQFRSTIAALVKGG